MAEAWRSPNHGPRLLPLDMIVLHYTGMQSAAAALERLCDPEAQVSAHFLIDEDGTCHHLVQPQRRAWHAGVSCWEDERDINSRSIGIELVNPGHAWGYRDFPDAQMLALLQLLGQLTRRYGIAGTSIWGHSDVAPLRKEDPGERFPWARLARHGFGLWPRPSRLRLASRNAQVLLHMIGYDVLTAAGFAASQTAFKRHFRPDTLGQRWTMADTKMAQHLAALKRPVLIRRRRA
ncbi:MAG: N-acetylmuramoyl-L-alanine amidase [Pseudomonadota bacterium]